MAANLSKKFALLCSSLLSMQALRLVISTAGFCAIRFHIDCSLLGIFISRLVNAVMMSQLFGNWLGDLFVFGLDGRWKIIATATANWAELICFCTALFSICHTEVGHLTGFYWSMAAAAFWWKVSEAPCTSIASPNATDYYFAGFTLSGVWAACLKWVVMRCITEKGSKALHFNSDVLGDVTVSVVGRRSAKTTRDYRASKWLYVITIVLTALMCSAWTVPIAVHKYKEQVAAEVTGILAGNEENVHAALKAAGVGGTTGVKDLWSSEDGVEIVMDTVTKVVFAGWDREGDKTEVAKKLEEDMEETKRMRRAGEMTRKAAIARDNELMRKVGAVKEGGTSGMLDQTEMAETLLGMGMMVGGMIKPVSQPVTGKVVITITVNEAWVLENDWLKASEYLSAVSFAGVLAVPGAMLGAGMGWMFAAYIRAFGQGRRGKALMWIAAGIGVSAVFEALTGTVVAAEGGTVVMKWMGGEFDKVLGDWVVTGAFAALGGLAILAVGAFEFVREGSMAGASSVTKRCQLIFGIVGGLGGMAAGVAPVMTDTKMVGEEKVEGMWVEALKTTWPTYKPWTRGVTVLAAMIGLGAGTFLGTIVGLCIGTIKGSKKRGTAAGAFFGSFLGLWFGEITNGALTSKPKDMAVTVCGVLIVVLGLGTVYSIYPGMAPCSITQFQYFNIIDILILALSAIGPLVIMAADLGNQPWRLAATVLANKDEKWLWAGIGVGLTIAVIICEIIVLTIMQHPNSKLAQKVTNSGWRAVLLTVTMVTSQLVSNSIGFACVAAGSGFNDGVINANSTVVMWTMQCTGIVGEGYLTELKKYEPGHWPTQGMGKWDTYWWWNGKAFINAWKIWCCIGTTDLRRDIMLCRK